MGTHHYTDKTYYEYDQTLTQGLLTKYINTLSSSSNIKTDMTYLWSIGNMSRFTGSRHEPNPDISSGESEEERPSTVTHNYVNLTPYSKKRAAPQDLHLERAAQSLSAFHTTPRKSGKAIHLHNYRCPNVADIFYFLERKMPRSL